METKLQIPSYNSSKLMEFRCIAQPVMFSKRLGVSHLSKSNGWLVKFILHGNETEFFDSMKEGIWYLGTFRVKFYTKYKF